MNAIVIYKSRYGSSKTYAEWIAEELGCRAVDVKGLKVSELLKYDTVIFGGGLYAEMIAGIHFVTKNFEKLSEKKIIVFSTGITPLKYREYYDKMVLEKISNPICLKKLRYLTLWER